MMRTKGSLAWAAWTLVLLLFVAASVLLVASGRRLGIWDRISAFLALGTFIFSFASVGALIASRRQSNPIGWLSLVVALAFALASCAFAYTEWGTDGTFLPGAAYAAWLATSGWLVGLVVPATFVLLLFPNGRLVDGRWRVVAIAASAGLAGALVNQSLTPGMLGGTRRSFENPFGVPALEPVLGVIGAFAVVAILVSTAGSIAALLVRFRHGTEVERRQIKWLLYAGAFPPLAWVAGLLLEMMLGSTESVTNVTNALLSVAVAAIPIAIGIAILKYRLYDIDLIINRTLVYGALTALLAAAYFGIVVLLQGLVPGAGDSDLTIAGSTLVVAALFRPLRARVQSFIDRRFYRRKVDAQRTLDDFTQTLREKIDLEALTRELVGVVDRTMEPTQVSLWLRPMASPSIHGGRI
jgi:hypothetical protein